MLLQLGRWIEYRPSPIAMTSAALASIMDKPVTHIRQCQCASMRSTPPRSVWPRRAGVGVFHSIDQPLWQDMLVLDACPV